MSAQPKLDPRGLKRVCSNCGNRFYDLNKRPIICPTCDTEYLGDVKVKRRGKAAEDEKAESQVKKETANDEDDEVASDDVADISLDEAADMEDSGDDEEDEALGDLDMDEDLADIDNIDDDSDDDLDDLDADIKVGKDDD